jgi:ABC-type transport system substrate-binding protein
VKAGETGRLFLASGCFLGLAPVVPGSFGALPGLAWIMLAVWLGWSSLATRFWCLWGVLLFSVVHYWLTPWAQKRWNDPDPKHFVLDEVVGALCVPLFWYLPPEPPYPLWQIVIAGFLLFRILDAIKLPIARYIDRNVHTASGVLFDDVVSAAYTAAIISACAWFLPASASHEPRAASHESRTTYRRALERVASMDPLQAASVPDSKAISLVYEPLLEVDYVARPYALKPCLCDMPEVSADGLVYTYRIREGARFQDDPCFADGKGRPVTAEDVRFSLARLADKSNASSGMWTMDPVAKVEAADARTVRVTLKKPLHVFPWLTAMAYWAAVPREAVEKYGEKFNEHAVGSGPYRLAEWWRNHRMVFEKDPTWPGWRDIGTTPCDTLEFLVVDDASTQWLMFLSGELDFLGEVSRDNWDAIVEPDGTLSRELEAKGMTLYAAPVMQVFYIGINMRDELLGKNRKLRQALNCAFDFPVWQRFMNNRVEECDGPVPPGVNGRLETPFPYAFNLEKAKQLMVEAGFPDGIDPKTGKHVSIPLAIGRATQSAREQAELLQSFYEKIGVRLEPQFMTWAAYLKAVSDGHVSLFMLGWVGDYPDAENFMQLFHSKNVSPGANHVNYVNPEFDRLYDAAMEAKTPARRDELWKKSQEIVREDCPWIFLNFAKAHALAWNRLRNYIPSDFPYGTEKYLWIQR